MKVIIGNQSVWLPESEIEEIKLRSFPPSYFLAKNATPNSNFNQQADEADNSNISEIEGDPKKLLNKIKSKNNYVRQVACDFCEKMFKNRPSMRTHCRVKHKNIKNEAVPPHVNKQRET